MFGVFEKFTTASVQLAQTLFMTLATLELGWTFVRWAMSSVPLEEYVANAYFKCVQMALLFVLISNAYSSPWGPGWFAMIVNGIVGMAQTTAGLNVVGTANNLQFTANITPGTIVDIGFSMFTMIMSAASSGINGWTLISGITNGSALLWFGTWLFALWSSCAVVFLMCFIGFRWFWITLKALFLGCMVFLSGFTGSRLTSPMGMAPFNAAFNVGIEMATHVVIIGFFYPIVTNYANQIGFSAALMGVPGVTVAGGAANVIQIGAILALDVGIAAWAYAIKRAPDLAAFAQSGVLRVSESEFAQHMRGSSHLAGAVGGAARAAGGAFTAASAIRSEGGEPTLGDRVKGAMGGALRGGLVAGPEGAIAGAAVGAATARGESSGQDEGSVRGGGNGRGFVGGFVSQMRGRSDGAKSEADVASASGAPVEAEGAEGAGGASPSDASTTRVGGEEVKIATDGDRVSATGAPGGADAAGAATDAAEAQEGDEDLGGAGSRTRTMRVGGSVVEPITQATGGAGKSGSSGVGTRPGQASGVAAVSPGDPTAQPEVGDAKGTSGGSHGGGKGGYGASTGGAEQGASSVDELTAALRENTAALRAHRFGGGGAGGASSRAAASSGGAESAGDAGGGGAGTGGQSIASSGPLGALLGGQQNALNPVNMMLYRSLLTVGQRGAVPIQNHERPAVQLGVSHIE
jgi:hypothetical protein